MRHLRLVEPFPVKPRQRPDASRGHGLFGLSRAADLDAASPPLALGEAAPRASWSARARRPRRVGRPGGRSRPGSSTTISSTERHRPPAAKPGSADMARWAAGRPAGVAWPARRPAPRSRSAERRRPLPAAPAHRARPASPRGRPPAACVELERPGRRPLFAAYHPVTGDQLLRPPTEDVAQLGYGAPTPIGWSATVAPATGSLAPRPCRSPGRRGSASRRAAIYENARAARIPWSVDVSLSLDSNAAVTVVDAQQGVPPAAGGRPHAQGARRCTRSATAACDTLRGAPGRLVRGRARASSSASSAATARARARCSSAWPASTGSTAARSTSTAGCRRSSSSASASTRTSRRATT